MSGGTYVRVLAADVGEALGCGAHLTALRRTAIGPFSVADARPPDDPGEPQPLERAVAHLPRCELIAEEAIAASHGRILGPAAIEGPYGVYDPDGRLIGVYRDDGGEGPPARDPRARVAQSSTWKNTASDHTASTSVPPTTATVRPIRRELHRWIEIGGLGGASARNSAIRSRGSSFR